MKREASLGAENEIRHEALQANRYLDSVVTRIHTIYYRLCEQSEAVTAQMVRDEFLGVKAPSKTLLSVFAEFKIIRYKY